MRSPDIRQPTPSGLHLLWLIGLLFSGTASLFAQSNGAKPDISAHDRVMDVAERLPPSATRPIDFCADVQPIFRRACYECHAGEHEDGGVNLGIRDRAMQGGDRGPIFVAGDSANSRIIHVVAAIDAKVIMPPESEGLGRDDISILRGWIDQGASWPSSADVPDPRVARAQSHWAFQPLTVGQQPPDTASPWPQTPIDRFILSNLEAASLSPREPASQRQLVRRISFDLVGLPPNSAQVDVVPSGVNADSARKVDEIAQQLLDSPHYGERWARHWLDVARYADSDGQESDRDRSSAYHYRDFVIQALNDDMPYDQFVRWQIAGDEYEPNNPAAVAATGFLAAGPFAALKDELMEDERLRNRYNELDDIMSTVGSGLLGLTMGCVRCHDHKYDAIPARDYYSMLNAFHGGMRAEVTVGDNRETVLAYRDAGVKPVPTWLFQRGNYYDRDQLVTLGFVAVLTRGRSASQYLEAARLLAPEATTSLQRRALAEWVTDVEHGAGALLARVIVNRVWQHHFGYGIVRTAGDFGVRSDPPTHPELLNWLASDFITHGWHLKRLHHMIVTSAVYQQASGGPIAEQDTDNRLLSRMSVIRLEGEVLRDSMLAVSGTLNTRVYGPSVKPSIAAEAILARNLKESYPENVPDSPELRRRSIYLFHKRVVPYPLLQAFDKPDAQQSCSRRDRTTVTPQALALMNDPFVRTVAADFAARLRREAGNDPSRCVELGFRLALARPPKQPELDACLRFLQEQVEARRREAGVDDNQKHEQQALTDLCQTIFGLNEFIYVD